MFYTHLNCMKFKLLAIEQDHYPAYKSIDIVPIMSIKNYNLEVNPPYAMGVTQKRTKINDWNF